LKNADIGIITFHPYPNHLKTLATKPFEYMLAGLPLIMSDFDYWKAFFKDLSLYVDPINPDKISKIINELLLDPKKMENMGKESKEKVFNEYNWNLEQKKLIRLYCELIEK
jgi:glycosyltransferase involved in cell wall biosynthesis